MADVLGRVVKLLRGGRGGGVHLAGGGGGGGGHAPAAQDEFFAHVSMGAVETCMLLVFGYISFSTAEAVGLSGIIAALFCGVTQARYATPILSWPGKKVSRAVLKLLAGLADVAIFLQIGLGLALAGSVSAGEAALAAVALAGCLLGRAANVFPIAGALNRACGGGGARGEGAITLPMQAQMWWAGLRGGIAFASALSFPSHHAGAVSRAVALLCVVTVATMGPTTVPLMRRLGIRFGVEEAGEAGGGGGARSGSWAERFEQAIYGKATWLQIMDAGAEGIDAAPILVLSPGKAGRSPRGSPATAPPAPGSASAPLTPDKRAADERPAAPLSPQGGAAAWEEDAAFSYNVRPAGV